MTHNAVLLMTCIFFGQVEIPRYLLTTVVLFVYTSGRYIYKYWLNTDIVGKILTCGFIFCILIEGANISIKSFDWQESLSQKKALGEFLVESGLEKGYATYWNAYSNEVYSNSEVKFGGINIEADGLSPFYWLVDSNTYEPEDKNTFLLLTSEEHDTLGFNIVNTFGAPINELRYNDYYIIVFNHDIVLNMKGVQANTN